jgi:hypothetical protein
MLYANSLMVKTIHAADIPGYMTGSGCFLFSTDVPVAVQMFLSCGDGLVHESLQDLSALVALLVAHPATINFLAFTAPFILRTCEVCLFCRVEDRIDGMRIGF